VEVYSSNEVKQEVVDIGVEDEADEDIGEEDREWQHVGTYC
jgi:hypothetical protein